MASNQDQLRDFETKCLISLKKSFYSLKFNIAASLHQSDIVSVSVGIVLWMFDIGTQRIRCCPWRISSSSYVVVSNKQRGCCGVGKCIKTIFYKCLSEMLNSDQKKSTYVQRLQPILV
jgi:hypothetical protein